ncbi:TIGR03749 family integrating conjugative element protein [Pseudomonas sp. Pseusp122]|uniref:TIGR03749 family integrating conjugative element protein n=1 Tax=unclassified Pseudomonas TaxID=196821 RepID=UPI0039A403A1
MATWSAQAVEIMRWERLPLAVPLVVGQERIVFLDQNVRVGIPRSLTDKLRVQSIGGAIYLLAKETIEPTRLQLQNVQTGEIMLVDIAAMTAPKDQAALEPVKIIAGDTTPTRYGTSKPAQKATSRTASAAVNTSDEEEAEEDDTPPKRETPVPVVLTRYASQMLYAPLRTVEPVEGIIQVKLDRRADLSTLLPTLPVVASALGSWQLDDYWVTAVKLRNQTTQRLSLDPRELMGDLVTATFQHNYLGAKGDATDTTTLYVVTRGHGIGQSVLPSIGQADPRVKQEADHER